MANPNEQSEDLILHGAEDGKAIEFTSHAEVTGDARLDELKSSICTNLN